MLAIVSAVFEEIEDLVVKLTVKKTPSGYAYTVGQTQGVIQPLGVGFLEAALNLREMLFEHPNVDQVLFMGTAGVYPGVARVRSGDLCACSETGLIDAAAEKGLAKYAQFQEQKKRVSSLSLDAKLPEVRVATALGLTLDDDLARTIQTQSGFEVENMELFGVASAAERKGVLWNAVLGVTNQVGPQGHQQWKENRKAVQAKTCDFLYQYLVGRG